MSLRGRLTLAGGAAVFVALSVASLVIYFAVESKLHDQINASLVSVADNVAFKFTHANGKPTTKLYAPAAKPKLPQSPFTNKPFTGTENGVYFEILPSLGAATKAASPQTALPTSKPTSGSGVSRLKANTTFVPAAEGDELVADGEAPSYFRNVRYLNQPMRLYTMQLRGSSDGVVLAARPLSETNSTLGRIRWLLIALTLGGAAAAALLGGLAAAAVLRPVRALAAAVQEVTATRDLDQRIDVSGRDELASLAANFNTMLGALDESVKAQQQLVADASHELRTPLTAHRTNVELLARPDLPSEGRKRALAGALRGIEELSALVNDLIQAARNGKQIDARQPLELDTLVAQAVKRAERRPTQPRFTLKLEPWPVSAAPARLERALDNLIDNAVKWNSNYAPIEVTLSDGVLTIRDHGPGVDADDLPHVFDRFYRATAARAQPGSGLGLAIVKQTVDDHGGRVSVANADSGGTIVSLTLPARA